MKQEFGQNLSQIGALYDFYGQKNLGRQSSEIELTRRLPDGAYFQKYETHPTEKPTKN